MAEDGSLTPKEKLIEKLDSIEECGMNLTKEWASMFQESLQYFFGAQLAGKKQHKDWDWIVVNYIWPSAMQEIAKLSKNNPKIIASPWEQSDAEVAEVWKSHLQWQWQVNLKMRIEQIKAILDKKLFGYSVSKIYWENRVDWDDKNKQWIGDVKYKLWHPAQFWADGGEDINDGNCGTVRFVPVEWAKARWPKHAKKLDLEAEKYAGPDLQVWGGDHIRGQLTAPTGTGYGGQDAGETSKVGLSMLVNLIMNADKMTEKTRPEKDEKLIKLSETYFRDYEEKHEKEEADIPAQELLAAGAIYQDGGMFWDMEGNPFPSSPDKWPTRVLREYNQPLYPYGRVVLRSDTVILGDHPWPYRTWPFVTSPHYLLPHMWQGSDGVQLYKTAQDMINTTVSHLTNNMKCYGDPKIKVETGAMEVNPRTKKAFKIGKGPGAVIRLVKNAIKQKRFEIEPPPPISAQALALYNLFAQEYKNIVGLQSIAKGEKQPGEMSATEAQWLALSSVDRIQLQSVFEDEWIKNICRLIGRLCQDMYDEGRFVRIVGEDNIVGVSQITQKLKTIRFDVDILAATTLPYDEDKRLQKHVQAYELLSQPIVNPMLPQMLRELEVDNWKKLVQQHEPWILWTQFLQLYQAVKTGEVEPREAVRVITNRVLQIAGQEQYMIPAPAEKKDEKTKRSKKS